MFGARTIVLFVVLVIFKVVSANIQVKTRGGIVEGVEVDSILKDEKYYSFMGIPYAQPPVGPLRFMPPKPHEGWEGILNAKKESKPCAQFNLGLKNEKEYGFCGEEDCLNLSVHTPRLPTENQDDKLPVIVVFINDNFKTSHNGTKDYGPDFFMKEDVIIVTVNYRLGSLGFLSMKDDLLPGNNGLRDVILALKWIKNNISNFGGDPNKVTLLGQQEGAALAEILLYSPKAKGLFHAVILQSGTVWNSYHFRGKARERAIELSKQIEEDATTTTFLLKRFADVTAQLLLEGEYKIIHPDESRAIQSGFIAFGPVIEHDHSDAVITKLPEEDSLNLNVPIMIGYTSIEALVAHKSYHRRPQFLTYAERDFLFLMPIRTGFHFQINSNIYHQAIKEIKDFYFEEGYVKIKKPGEYTTYISDIISNYAIDYAVRKYTNESKSDVFYYVFDYSGEFNMIKKRTLNEAKSFHGTWGATNGDDLCYLFLCKKIKKAYSKALEDGDAEELTVLNNMVRMWANFARTGNPTPQSEEFTWKPATKENKECLVISEELEMKNNLNEERIKFWDNWIDKYRSMSKDGIIKDEKDEL